jgi:hypothetical protein
MAGQDVEAVDTRSGEDLSVLGLDRAVSGREESDSAPGLGEGRSGDTTRL